MGYHNSFSLLKLRSILFRSITNKAIYIFKMSLTFFHPYLMKPRYFRRKPINMDFEELSTFPFFFNSCLDDLNLKLQKKNQNEDYEKNFATKINLEGFEPKDINLELSSDKRKIKINAKNGNKIRRTSFLYTERIFKRNKFARKY